MRACVCVSLVWHDTLKQNISPRAPGWKIFHKGDSYETHLFRDIRSIHFLSGIIRECIGPANSRTQRTHLHLTLAHIISPRLARQEPQHPSRPPPTEQLPNSPPPLLRKQQKQPFYRENMKCFTMKLPLLQLCRGKPF